MRETPSSAVQLISESVSWRTEPYSPNKYAQAAAPEPESLSALRSAQHTSHTGAELIFGELSQAENAIVGRLVDRTRTQNQHTDSGAAYPSEEPVVKGNAYEIAKRAIDIALSSLVLAIGFPLLLFIALAIKLTSKGPVLFKQQRLGRHGKVFSCYKFRTMIVNAEEFLQRNPDLQAQFNGNFKLKNDPRISLVGGFLRKTSLDELPQFINVLQGSMSIIGPRPIVPSELVKYGPYSQKLLCVKPGLGGLWQVSGRSNLSYDRRVALDALYIQHRSVTLDCELLLATAVNVLGCHGAY